MPDIIIGFIIFSMIIRFFMIVEEFSPWRVYLRRAKTPVERIYAVALMIPVLGEFMLLTYGLFQMISWVFENVEEGE